MTIPYASLAVTVDVTLVIDVAAHALGETAAALCGDDLNRRLTRHRAVAMAAARMAGHSYPAVGRAFGGRDHTTVMSACKRVAAAPELAERARIIAAEATTPRSLF